MKELKFPHQTNFYRGKVRDVYTIEDKFLVMIASDRISAFDVILPRPIPHKGQVLNQIAAYMLKATTDICPNWLLDAPAPNVAIGKKCKPFRVEMVVRGNLSGHAWRTYSSGKRVLCGANLPEGMKENDYFPRPIITPSTKATVGHDEDISPDQILNQGLVSPKQFTLMETYTLALFERGRDLARQRGLILVDTKYEFGSIGDTVYLMDEIHTPDSSRYFYAEGYEQRQALGEKQKQLSKEFVREWLIDNNFMGKEGQSVPEMTDAWVQTISGRYIELFERITGEKFRPLDLSDEETYQRILFSLSNLR
jgi:phosphoribosylaminoimidazole-succinocarboxamide synthase